MKPDLLQLCPLMPSLEADLAERFTVHRLHEAADAEAFLATHGAAIKAVATGGHIGLPLAVGARLPALEIVAINGVGFDKVDLAEARRRGYRVANTPDVLTEDVADLAVGLTIAALRQLVRGDGHVRAGEWPKGDLPLGRKMSRKKFGIVGLGRIGRAIAKRLQAFDGEIGYASRSPQDVPYRAFESPAALAAWCDVLIIAAAASAETRHLINGPVLEALGPKGVLVNVARGSLVDEKALLHAVQHGQIAGAALDVFENEPHVPEGFHGLPNVVLTPHMASATHETRADMAALVIANLDAHFAGRELPTPVV